MNSQEPAKPNVEAASSRFSTYQYFNPYKNLKVTEANLPHWNQDEVTYFVTFRLADSLPQVKLTQWKIERDQWLAQYTPPHTDEQKADYYDRFAASIEEWLDTGYGSCCLNDPENKILVQNTLKHFDKERYSLGRYVVAGNHVHVLVTPLNDNTLSTIIHSWKSYTATRINARLKQVGPFWQKEYYDHIVRSVNAAYHIERYIDRHKEKRQDAASTL